MNLYEKLIPETGTDARVSASVISGMPFCEIVKYYLLFIDYAEAAKQTYTHTIKR